MRAFGIAISSVSFFLAAGLLVATFLLAGGATTDAAQPSGNISLDGLDDILVYNPSLNSGIAAFGFANGDGTWYNGTVENPGASVVPLLGDFNGDGLPDVFAYYYQNSGAGRVFFTDGTGDLLPGPAGWYFGDSQIEVGNFNGDEYADVFTYEEIDDAEAIVTLGDGFGWWSQAPSTTWTTGWRIYTGNFNADELTDLFLYRDTTGESWVELANGDGSWTDEQQPNNMLSPSRYLDTADFNGDGLTDLYQRNDFGFGVSGPTLLRNSNGGFTAGSSLSFSGSEGHITFADYTGDGRDDGFASNNDGATRMFVADSEGHFDSGVDGENPLVSGRISYAGDFNGDDLADLLYYSIPMGDSNVLLSNGDGTFTDGPYTEFNPGWTYILVGDFGTSPNAITPTPSPTPTSPTPTPTTTLTATPTASPTPAATSPGETPTPSGSPTPSPTLPATLLQGDINCDGQVTIEDVAAFLAYLSTHESGPPGCQPAAANPASAVPFGDVNCDAFANTLDVLNIIRHLVDLSVVNPSGECAEIGDPIAT